MDINQLVSILKKASIAYYNSGTTIMSDEEYDKLADQLRQQDPNNAFFKSIGAPPEGTIVKHQIPMGSQEKLKDKAEFDRWAKTISNYIGPNNSEEQHTKAPFVMQLKLDGSSVALNYEDGELVSAVTRGNGLEGEDITPNVIQMGNVKKKLPGFTGSLRGEMILKISAFVKVFEPLGYKNPRNTVAGLSRDRKSGDMQKHLDVIYYDICMDRVFPTETERINFIKNTLDLTPVKTYSYSSSEKVWEAYKKVEEIRGTLEYECDGVVIRANSTHCQHQLGTSSDLRPKGQRCVKFAPMGAVTILKAVEIAVGHTGAIIPRAILEPVIVGGVTVTHTTLSNFEEVERLGIALGDKVRITRRGDVIPKLENKVEEGKNRIKIEVPTVCPSCGSLVVKDGAHIFCRNDNCKGKNLRRILTYAEKRNIKYLGDELVAELFENHGVTEPYHLYSLTEEKLSKVKRGLGVVGCGAKQVMAEIEKSKECPLNEFIGSLCIPLLGRRQAEIMINQGIDTLDKFMSVNVETLRSLTGFSEEGTKAPAIVEGIRKAKELIMELKKHVQIKGKKPEPAIVTGGKLSNLSFCFTGTIEKTDENGERYTRKRMWEIVKVNGGKALEGVEAGLSFLVQADPTIISSKTKKALKLRVEIISEADFWKMVE